MQTEARDLEKVMGALLQEMRKAFVARLSEWCFAVILAMWGVVLLLPVKTFEGDAWVAFRPLIGETTLGWLCLFGGLIRLMILALNGTFRPMYHLRAFMALTSAIVWFSISLGFLSAQIIGPWMAVYPVLFAFDVANMFRATTDAAAVDLMAQQGNKRRGRT